jgi:HPr kinase/phosphorylase
LKTSSLRKLNKVLAEKVTPQINCHGVLVQIFGVGTLIIGESGVGKSEIALDLVLHGHKLVADDLVVLENNEERISGRPLELGADHIHIRGLGIINIRALYGESAVAASCGVGLVVELEEQRKGRHYNLTGLREQRYRLLGINLPYLRLPVRAGQNMATLIEVAARNQSLKQRGIFAARDFNKRLKERLVR